MKRLALVAALCLSTAVCAGESFSEGNFTIDLKNFPNRFSDYSENNANRIVGILTDHQEGDQQYLVIFDQNGNPAGIIKREHKATCARQNGWLCWFAN